MVLQREHGDNGAEIALPRGDDGGCFGDGVCCAGCNELGLFETVLERGEVLGEGA